MFFKPKYKLFDKNTPVCISADTKISVPEGNASEFIKNTLLSAFGAKNVSKKAINCKKIVFKNGLPKALAKEVSSDGNEEEYAIVIGETTYIYANTERGFVYGGATLAALSGKTFAGKLYDKPVCPIRGYRVYLPGRQNIPVFKNMIDFLAEYKYNSAILEIGGAMEYKRHPEINEKWVEFCDEVYADPHRADVIQHKTYPWTKDSIHCENGDGGVLTQDECRELSDYCRSRGIEVIPEVPTLSHADYICLAHPEIAERPEDAYPDTYCPNNPDSYKYVFDIIDEVIDVFQPKQIHIGHDEAYTLGICDKCKHTDPVELYVNDIIKIKEYLDTKNVKTSMWAEKLLRAYTKAGTPVGGTGATGFRNGGQWAIPALWRCRDLLPKDIIYANWYWVFGDHHDRVYHDREFKMFYGNLSAILIDNWEKRIKWGALGGWVSNWGSFEEEYMQRNIQYFDLISSADAFWNTDFDSENKKSILNKSFKEAYRRKWKNTPNTITIKHRTLENIPHEYFWCGVFIENKKYLIGNYEIEYADGTKALLPVKYGTNIGAAKMPKYPADNELMQLAGAALPMGENGDLFYECKYVDPNPDSDILSIKYVPILQEFTVEYGVE